MSNYLSCLKFGIFPENNYQCSFVRLWIGLTYVYALVVALLKLLNDLIFYIWNLDFFHKFCQRSCLPFVHWFCGSFLFCFFWSFVFYLGKAKERRECKVLLLLTNNQGKTLQGGKAGKCQPRGAFPNGVEVIKQTKDGIMAQYTCNKHYKLKG